MEGKFTLLQLFGVMTILGALLALTSVLKLLSFPFWLLAILLWLILHPRHRSSHMDSTSDETRH
ncbi:MAG: hypothetical protein QGG36_12265 [Pirellulaceae bacterium]|jgi:hypothetical protein|nr:hypothetical protein [Pirellulaceae bacterium]MDP7016570.1 hypothetical protein [Pirellulaceae bacterium]